MYNLDRLQGIRATNVIMALSLLPAVTFKQLAAFAD